MQQDLAGAGGVFECLKKGDSFLVIFKTHPKKIVSLITIQFRKHPVRKCTLKAFSSLIEQKQKLARAVDGMIA